MRYPILSLFTTIWKAVARKWYRGWRVLLSIMLLQRHSAIPSSRVGILSRSPRLVRLLHRRLWARLLSPRRKVIPPVPRANCRAGWWATRLPVLLRLIFLMWITQLHTCIRVTTTLDCMIMSLRRPCMSVRTLSCRNWRLAIRLTNSRYRSGGADTRRITARLS